MKSPCIYEKQSVSQSINQSSQVDTVLPTYLVPSIHTTLPILPILPSASPNLASSLH